MEKGHPHFTPAAIEQLHSFQVANFSVACLDYKEAIKKQADSFLYLDPPYKTKYYLYGYKGSTHKGFNHEEFAGILHKRARWILSYNDCPDIRSLHEGYTIIPVSWQYGLPRERQAKEVLILSHDVQPPR